MTRKRSTWRDLFVATSFALLSVALAGASCDRKSAAKPDPEPGIGSAGGHDDQEPQDHEPKTPAPEVGKPYPDPKLAPDQVATFEVLAAKLPSPCGKGHSLKVSIASDPSCKRTPFASRYVKMWIAENVAPDQIEELYAERYQQEEAIQIELGSAAYDGIPNAPVVIVEFFDYGCGHCKAAAPRLDDLMAEFPSELVIYYKHFVLNLKSPSLAAAIASVAAQRQGKFKPVHRRLFSSGHSTEELRALARDAGLDMARFEADFESRATREQVLSDREEGDKLGIGGTPSIYVNGRRYTDSISVTEFRDWVNEEIAVNR